MQLLLQTQKLRQQLLQASSKCSVYKAGVFATQLVVIERGCAWNYIKSVQLYLGLLETSKEIFC